MKVIKKRNSEEWLKCVTGIEDIARTLAKRKWGWQDIWPILRTIGGPNKFQFSVPESIIKE